MTLKYRENKATLKYYVYREHEAKLHRDCATRHVHFVRVAFEFIGLDEPEAKFDRLYEAKRYYRKLYQEIKAERNEDVSILLQVKIWDEDPDDPTSEDPNIVDEYIICAYTNYKGAEFYDDEEMKADDFDEKVGNEIY